MYGCTFFMDCSIYCATVSVMCCPNREDLGPLVCKPNNCKQFLFLLH